MDKESYHQSPNQFKTKFAKSKLQKEQESLRDFKKKIHEIERKLKAAIKQSSKDCGIESENDDECCSNSECGKDFTESENISNNQNEQKLQYRRIMKSTLTQEQQKIKLKALEKQLNSIRLGSDNDSEFDGKDYAKEFGNEKKSSDIDIESIVEKSKLRMATAEKQRQKYLAKIYGVEKKSRAAIHSGKEHQRFCSGLVEEDQ